MATEPFTQLLLFVVLVHCILQTDLSSLAPAACLKPKPSFPAAHLLQSFPLLPALISVAAAEAGLASQQGAPATLKCAGRNQGPAAPAAGSASERSSSFNPLLSLSFGRSYLSERALLQ